MATFPTPHLTTHPPPPWLYSEEDKETLENAVKETLEWLDENQSATAEEFKEKQKEIEKVANPIMQSVYQKTGGSSGGEGGEEGGDDESFVRD